MIIANYDVKASSQRTYLSVQSATMTAKKAVRPLPGMGEVKVSGIPSKESDTPKGNQDRVTLSDEIKEKYAKLKDDSLDFIAQKSGAAAVRKAGKGPKVPKSPEELKISLLEMMLELMSGKKVKLKLNDSGDFTNEGSTGFNMTGFQGNAPQMSFVEGWEIEQFQFESEQVSYQAQAFVTTADGKMISVDINMNMSREFVSYTNLFIENERPCDPLVINYGGTAASLSGEKFDFDLNFDGKTDKISVLGEGSGFLAIDKNGDGKINDGRELFGPSSGSGFAELREYDGDRNGWIDEADDVFSKLLIWSHDKYGNEQLFTLKELGIGAIFLGDVDTQFSFKDSNNQTQGIMRSTSFFLKENGDAGTISHVDMMI